MLMAKTSGAMIELCERVESWRRREGGGPGKRVPDELWEQAGHASCRPAFNEG